MPHQCTGCGHTFADGSKEMLSGCPDCGGNKFQFRPEGASLPDDPSDAAAPAGDGESTAGEAEPPEPEGPSSVAETVGRATTRVRDFVSSDPGAGSPDPNASWPSERDGPEDSGRSETAAADPSASSGTDDDIIDADARREAREDDAQASARTDVVSDDELDVAAPEDTGDAGTGVDALASNGTDPLAGSGGDVVDEQSGDDPDIAELREQLNDQFESIKIVEPGQYELNLMELYDREEYIIALQENGRYVIQVPEQWMGDEPGDR
jgi:predicted  nucleic acid-binding Zn-ribbon protein